MDAPNAMGRTRAVTDCAAQEVEPACAFASAPVLDCWYAPEVTDQLPPEVLQPDASPSSKVSEESGGTRGAGEGRDHGDHGARRKTGERQPSTMDLSRPAAAMARC